MSYCISQGETRFLIKTENFPKAINILRVYANSFATSWCPHDDTVEYCNQQNLSAALSAEYFVPEYAVYNRSDTDIVGICFTGEKSGEEDKLLRALAPVIEDDSYITFVGEDGAMWRYVFVRGKMYATYPHFCDIDPEHTIKVTELCNRVCSRLENTPDGRIRDADTVLADVLAVADNELSGIARELISIWMKSGDKLSVERLFELLSGVSFEEYLEKCQLLST